MSGCRSCGEDVAWAHHHESQRMMPFDPPEPYDPDNAGLWTIRKAAGTLVAYPLAKAFAIVQSKYELDDAATHERLADECVWRRSHFATCPHANDWRTRERTVSAR